MDIYKNASIKVKNLEELHKEREEERKKENVEKDGQDKTVALDLRKELLKRMLAEQKALRERRASETADGEEHGLTRSDTRKGQSQHNERRVQRDVKSQIKFHDMPTLTRRSDDHAVHVGTLPPPRGGVARIVNLKGRHEKQREERWERRQEERREERQKERREERRRRKQKSVDSARRSSRKSPPVRQAAESKVCV